MARDTHHPQFGEQYRLSFHCEAEKDDGSMGLEAATLGGAYLGEAAARPVVRVSQNRSDRR